MPTPKEPWNDLLRELKAASTELHAAFVSLLKSRGAIGPGESRQTAAKAETQRYNEAVRRSDTINAKVKARRSEVRATKMRIESR